MSHEDEVWSLIDGAVNTAYDGHVPKEPSFPYVVRFDATPRRSINSMRHTSNRLDYRFRVTSVGLTADSVRIIRQAVQGALLDVTVTVAGWTSYPIRDVPNDQPMREDREVTVADGWHPLLATDEYHLAAEPA